MCNHPLACTTHAFLLINWSFPTRTLLQSVIIFDAPMLRYALIFIA